MHEIEDWTQYSVFDIVRKIPLEVYGEFVMYMHLKLREELEAAKTPNDVNVIEARYIGNKGIVTLINKEYGKMMKELNT